VLRAVRRLPDDLHDTYTAAYDLATADPRAMPKDGDFITGTAAAMATAMLAARGDSGILPGGHRRPAN
jgi:hypothetical protein